MSSASAVISVEGLSKRYRISHQLAGQETFREMLGRRARGLLGGGGGELAGAEEDFWALKDVSFEVRQGEVLGVIGRNGAGKSTLLKILSRITPPTEGRVTIKGKVASLLEVGTGFHPELTGRENIFLNGAILGMSRRDIAQRFDEIVDFAEVERFLDTPVKRYSSGMYVRLAFAVASHMEPEVLVIDEVLAVGDTKFQEKCIGKIRNVAHSEGRTVLFVSHSMPSIQQLCTSVQVLSKGGITFTGSPQDSIAHYLKSLSEISNQEIRSRGDRHGNGKLRIVDVTFHSDDGEMLINGAISGQPLVIRLHYESQYIAREVDLDIAFNLQNESGFVLTCFANLPAGYHRQIIYQSGYLECRWSKVNLHSGTFTSRVFLSINGETADWIENAFQLHIEAGDFFQSGRLVPRELGEVLMEQSWRSVNNKK